MSLLKRRIVSRGFTIVELLIVIVIIGILSTLVFVSYTGISDLARKAALSSNAQSVLRSIKVYQVDNESFDPLTLDETNVQSTLNMDSTGYEALAMYNQAGENYIYIVGKGSFVGLVACGIQGSINVYKADEAACAFGGSGNVIASVAGDEAGVLGGGNGSSCALAMEISSIEDLTQFSKDVNNGNNYGGICVKLTVDLDFNQNKSYVNKDTTEFGDINGNGTTEGLKTELTTGAGFVPIGNNPNNFAGYLVGEQHTIYNLMINRPTTSDVGFIGRTSGWNSRRLTGLNLTDVNIIGGDRTGGAVGYLHTQDSVSDMKISGNVTGNWDVGMAVGNMGTFSALLSVITSGNVTGFSSVGGVAGYSYHGFIRAINTDGSVVCTGSGCGRVLGVNDGADRMAYANSAITVNGATINDIVNDVNGNNGGAIGALSDITGNINAADSVLDTYIGGDDGDGWYWDYDGGGTLVKKNTTTDPLTFSLAGSGTSGDPYLIANYADLKMATLRLDRAYKLTADINLSGQRFYMFGSYGNTFSGIFYGNNKTISNLTINAPKASYLGFIGCTNAGNSRKLTSLNLTSASITGNDRIGVAVGFLNTQDSISDMTISGNVTGNWDVGGVVGLMGTYSTMSSVISSGNVTGRSSVGGVAGFISNANIYAINSGGSVTYTGGEGGRIFGGRDGSTRMGYAASSITVNGATITDTVGDAQDKNGGAITALTDITGNINAADSVLDTYIGGDNDGNGYYWDYDGGGNLVKKNTTADPLTFGLTGSGTTGDPYLIANYTDLKQATLRLDRVYKLTADINLSGQLFYMFGTYGNTFSGLFYGNNKTISNLTINAPKASYLGFIGSTNYGNSRKLTGLNLANINIVGSNNIGGAVGYLNVQDSVSDMKISGNITGNYNVGMAVGLAGTFSTLSSIVTSGNVTGYANVGGVAGFLSNANVGAINTGGSIVFTGYAGGRIYGARDGSTRNAYAVSTTTVNGSTVSSADLSDNNGKDTTVGALSLQSTYTDVGFNFTNETLDYIWYISGPTAVFREGSL